SSFRLIVEYIVLLNSDVEVTENWLKPLIQFLERNQDYAACQPKIKDFNRPDYFEYAGACGGFIDWLGYPFCRGRIFDEIEKDHGQYDNEQDIFWSSGACMVIRKSVYSELKGFDEDFFAHMEEIDLCWRIRSAGLKIRAIPQSTVFHVGGGTLSKSSPFKTYLNFRNGLSLLIKNLPGNSLLFKLPIRIFLDWVAALRFLLSGDEKHSLAVIKSHFHAFSMFLSTIKKRNLTSDSPQNIKVVWEFFWKRKSKFSELNIKSN
ncbi:MAG: glycosyltransferase family 2 protein, partial [Ekhidna sp.]|nr:glycosyltransferase family 2 protein [Ekhidna sp.]